LLEESLREFLLVHPEVLGDVREHNAQDADLEWLVGEEPNALRWRVRAGTKLA